MPPVLNPKHFTKFSFYTNSYYLVVVIPPPFCVEYNYDSKTFLCRTFNLRNGELVGNFSQDTRVLGTASCFDSVNNVIWNYSGAEAQMTKFYNEGLAPKHEFPNIHYRSNYTTFNHLVIALVI